MRRRVGHALIPRREVCQDHDRMSDINLNGTRSEKECSPRCADHDAVCRVRYFLEVQGSCKAKTSLQCAARRQSWQPDVDEAATY